MPQGEVLLALFNLVGSAFNEHRNGVQRSAECRVIYSVIINEDPDDGAYLRGDGFYDDYLKTEEGFAND